MAKKILIIDDEQDVIEYLTELLEANGFVTCSAHDGKEGFEVLKREKPDLITLDLQMPGDTGTDFYRNMHRSEEFKHIPIVVISGIAGKHLAIKKPLAVLDKPIDRFQLLETVEGALN